MGDFWPLLTIFGLIMGVLLGLCYGFARRRWAPPPGWRRVPGEPLGLRGRAAAAFYGAAVVGAACALTLQLSMVLMGGALGAVTAFALPGRADLHHERR